ncbi:MAG: hypothetical protein MUO50_03530, partial [Longimicrobiales bacterium]|nr:hypothetical protein [Longimicrobiales bacterium]
RSNSREQRINVMRRHLVSMCGALFVAVALASPLSAQAKVKAVSHDVEGKANCLMCHAVGVMEPVPDVPASHEGRAIETCMMCHAPTSPMVTTGAKLIPHDLEGKANCLMCHAAGIMPPVPDIPENHAGRVVEMCTWCHKTAGL